MDYGGLQRTDAYQNVTRNL